MNGEHTVAFAAASWIGAGLLLLVALVLSVALAAMTALGRSARRRVPGDDVVDDPIPERFDDPSSAHRIAAALMRSVCLAGAGFLLVFGFQGAGRAPRELLAAGLVLVLVVLSLESLLARSLALWNPRRALAATTGVVRISYFLLFPVVVPLERLYGKIEGRQDEEKREEEEVEALIQAGEREGLLEAEEGEMMRSIVDLDQTQVREIMTPRLDIVALPAGSTVAEARHRLIEGGHSRLPVYRGSIDDTIGVLHARDLFRAWEDGGEEQPVTEYLRPVVHVQEDETAARLLREMQMRTKLALVVDEYGGVSGLVTLEDLLEEIVGEIRDEHEQHEEDAIRRIDDGSWEIQAWTHVEELEKLFDLDLGERDFDTVGGLVVSSLGRVPEVGETVEVAGLRFEVLQAEKRRILAVRVVPLVPPSAEVETT